MTWDCSLERQKLGLNKAWTQTYKNNPFIAAQTVETQNEWQNLTSKNSKDCAQFWTANKVNKLLLWLLMQDSSGELVPCSSNLSFNHCQSTSLSHSLQIILKFTTNHSENSKIKNSRKYWNKPNSSN